MKWLWHVILWIFITMEAVLAEQIDDSKARGTNNIGFKQEHNDNPLGYVRETKGAKKLHLYSKWSRWGACQDGRKIRRRQCLRRQICGHSLRIEVARCKGSHGSQRRNIANIDKTESNSASSRKNIQIQKLQVRQLDNEDVQKMFRGFSPWSSWSSCSRKCTTVRKRVKLNIVRKLAGLRTDFEERVTEPKPESPAVTLRGPKKRRNVGTSRNGIHLPTLGNNIQYTVLETMRPPALAIHPEDSRIPRTAIPECGKLGRIRGTAAARMRARMRDMIRIIGGRPAPPGKWTWQVAVLNRYKEAFCGGTLVALRWVVTAAHCVRKRLYVRLGEHDLLVRNYGELEMKVTEAVTHPRYDPDTVVNDVAMLRLPFAARPDLGHGLACLPPPHQVLPPHTTCVILGWGKKRPTDIHGTRILHEAQVSTIQQGVCRRSYWQYAITDNMVCAGRGRRDSCAGDSGGPLLCRARNMRYYLQGITSFGDGCGKRGKYGIYTRTAGYVAWMHEVMSKKYFD